MPHKSVTEYISKIEEKYKTGQAREHAYRPAFEAFATSSRVLTFINDRHPMSVIAPAAVGDAAE